MLTIVTGLGWAGLRWAGLRWAGLGGQLGHMGAAAAHAVYTPHSTLPLQTAGSLYKCVSRVFTNTALLTNPK